VLELYRRPDNALFVPETLGSPSAARFFFSALGMGAIGYSPFGLDYTRLRPQFEGDNEDAKNGFLKPTAQNYRLIELMMRGPALGTIPSGINSRSLHCGRDDNSPIPATCEPGDTPTQRQNCHPDRSGGTCCSSSPITGSRARRVFLFSEPHGLHQRHESPLEIRGERWRAPRLLPGLLTEILAISSRFWHQNQWSRRLSCYKSWAKIENNVDSCLYFDGLSI
jgi:hypothetical protein